MAAGTAQRRSRAAATASGTDAPIGQPCAPERRVGRQGRVRGQQEELVAGQKDDFRELGRQGTVDAGPQPLERRAGIVLLPRQAQGKHAPRCKDRLHLGKKLLRVEAVELARRRLWQVEHDDVKGFFLILTKLADVHPPVHVGYGHAGIVQRGGLGRRKFGPGSDDDQRVQFDVMHRLDRGMAQRFGQAAAHPAADEQHPAGLWVGQQRQVGHLLGDHALRLEKEQPVLEKDSLFTTAGNRDPPIDRVSGKAQLAVLPTESRAMKPAAEGQSANGQCNRAHRWQPAPAAYQ